MLISTLNVEIYDTEDVEKLWLKSKMFHDAMMPLLILRMICLEQALVFMIDLLPLGSFVTFVSVLYKGISVIKRYAIAA